jgi:2-polyprenyl-3-methyl-5-hydroxy-6-metoxy-1,4-benzoquinol methylase
MCLCGGSEFEAAFTYHKPPAGEVRFDFSSSGSYFRRILRCKTCGHFLSVHDMDMTSLYRAHYVNSTYGDDGIRCAFERIIALDPVKSDNVGRVKRIVEFAPRHFPGSARSRHSVLDVGSGLCVFLHRLKSETGWDCTALDPDPRAAAHARERVGVNAVCGDFMQLNELGWYNIVTFNKVLEHVVDPVAMLARSRCCLNPGGFVYIELPDGEAACVEGQSREEFFIDHHHIFSADSVRALAKHAGFALLELERLREPSMKFTLRAFLTPIVRKETGH